MTDAERELKALNIAIDSLQKLISSQQNIVSVLSKTVAEQGARITELEDRVYADDRARSREMLEILEQTIGDGEGVSVLESIKNIGGRPWPDTSSLNAAPKESKP